MIQDVVLLPLIAVRHEFVKPEIFVTVRGDIETLKIKGTENMMDFQERLTSCTWQV